MPDRQQIILLRSLEWDDSYSRDNFNSGSRPSRDGAWIVENSWGNQEGSNGYTYISYEDKSLCEFVAGQFVKASEYKYNYFYDGSANPGILKLKKGTKVRKCIYSEKRKCKEERTDQSSEPGDLVCKRQIQYTDL